MAENGGDESKKLKSSYELALDRMEQEGIDRPRKEAFSADSLEAIGEARNKAEAKLAELEILHGKQLETLFDPGARAQEEQQYQAERQRIEDRKERLIAGIREASGGDAAQH